MPLSFRPVTGNQLNLLLRRAPTLPKSQATPARVLAIDPLQEVLAHYPEARRQDALSRARMLQGDEPLQYLEDAPNEGRWFDREGLTSYEIPLLSYPGERLPGARDFQGLYRYEVDKRIPQPRASIQQAGELGGPVLQEEAIHAIDRLLPFGGRASRRLEAPEAFTFLLGDVPFPEAQRTMRYYGDPAEMRATLSGLLPKFNQLDTPQDAMGMLETVRDRVDYPSTVRELATAEGILRSKPLRNEMIPYLLKALGVGGVTAGTQVEQ